MSTSPFLTGASSTLSTVLAAQISAYLIGGHSHMTAEGRLAIARLIDSGLEGRPITLDTVTPL